MLNIGGLKTDPCGFPKDVLSKCIPEVFNLCSLNFPRLIQVKDNQKFSRGQLTKHRPINLGLASIVLVV